MIKKTGIPGSRVPCLVLATVIALSVTCSGCGKKKTAETAPATTQEVAQATPNADTATQPPAPPTAQTTPQAGTEPIDLNRELRRWIVSNRRPPRNFEDFAATAGIQIPPPPDGKKYAIDKTMHVILVKR